MIDADSLDDLQRSFSAALSTDNPAAARRALLQAGWLQALEADQTAAVDLVFTIQGHSLTDAAALDDVIAFRMAPAWPELSDAFAAGDVAVAFPGARGTGLSDQSQPIGTTTSSVVLPAHCQASHLLWIDDLVGSRAEVIDLGGSLIGTTVSGIDPQMGLVELTKPPPGKVHPPGEGLPALWDQALAAGRIALSFQLVSGARSILTSTVAYARERRQFGVPIGSFQAVKHRLAETLVAVSAAHGAVIAAATTQSPTGAAVAKVLAGRAATTAARHCLQVLGGIGFTEDHEFHRFFRRGLMLNRLLGDPESLERDLGRGLRTGTLGCDPVVSLEDLLRTELLRAI